ncbi:MAG: SPOR domain-containing protein [Nitrospinales bacterium]
MFYQTYKYLIVRLGISIFFLLTAGYMVLYLVHEVALQQAVIQGDALKWGLGLISLIIGFTAYGFIGENSFNKSLENLEDIDLKADEKHVIKQFEKLLRFTYSSCFLPNKGKKLRQKVTRRYASYLLGLGKEDPRSLKLYLSAFLQFPEDSKFRSPIISVLTRKQNLDRRERDLLHTMLKAGDYQDTEIFNHLVNVLIQQKQFTSKTEPLFARALEKRIDQADKVVEFLLPILLKKKREDTFAIRVYLNILPFVSETIQSRLKESIGKIFCEEKYITSDQNLHERCGSVFETLSSADKIRMKEAAENRNVFKKWKKVKIITGEDIETLDSWKFKLGLTRSTASRVSDGSGWFMGLFVRFGKNILLQFLSALKLFGSKSLQFKLASVTCLLIILFVGFGLVEWDSTSNVDIPNLSQNEENKSPLPIVERVHTIQIGAVTTQEKVDQISKILKKRNVKDLYIVKVKRQTGGYWYKIRAGHFKSEEEAKVFGNRLIDNKAIKNYFVITLGN